MITGGSLPSNVSLSYGLDEDKTETPKEGAIYLATDTNIVYVCYVAGSWSNSSPAIPIMTEDRLNIFRVYSLSTAVLISSSATRELTTTYEKVAQFIIPDNFIHANRTKTGLIKVAFSYYGSWSGRTIYAQFRRNGEINGSDLSYATDASFNWYEKTADREYSAGDTVELWVRASTNSTGGGMQAGRLKIMGDVSGEPYLPVVFS
ncbi:hypothetical protein [Methanolobus sp.]|uniref:hypothetical protein n=1 Tax=Methanolobus sp. TaxID=1874737 RepID=UPI0025DCC7A2|nr:hypothetical protein [Methanolobus sp.]